MEAQLTFGEYMRRLRRSRKWNLNALAEATGISYTHLSRLENDSTLPSADSVARLAESLDGDLIAMLDMADCLPRTILDRIRSREDETAGSLKRTAGLSGNSSEDSDAGLNLNIVAELKQGYGLEEDEARRIARAIYDMVNLGQSRRSGILNLITSLSIEEDEAG